MLALVPKRVYIYITIKNNNKTTEIMTIQELEAKKVELTIEVNGLVSLKKKLYSSVDIESAMSSEEKELTNRIAFIFGELNKIVKQKRALK